MPKWNPRRREEKFASPMRPLRTHAEVGAIMGISKDVSEDIERGAMKKLRDLVADLGLTFEDFQDDDGPRVFVREQI